MIKVTHSIEHKYQVEITGSDDELVAEMAGQTGKDPGEVVQDMLIDGMKIATEKIVRARH